MLTITEPHPTVQANAYIHSGRGGAGNTFRAPSHITPTAGVPTLANTVSHVSSSSAAASSASSTTRFYAGRGGAGNACAASERRSISLDDEYASAVARATWAGHVGRGGAGNVYKTPADINPLAGTPAAYVSTADKIANSLRKLGRKGSDASDASDVSGFFRRH